MKEETKHDKQEAYLTLGTGAGIGAYGTSLAVGAGYICPACVIAAPALLGYGVYKLAKSKKKRD